MPPVPEPEPRVANRTTPASQSHVWPGVDCTFSRESQSLARDSIMQLARDSIACCESITRLPETQLHRNQPSHSNHLPKRAHQNEKKPKPNLTIYRTTAPAQPKTARKIIVNDILFPLSTLILSRARAPRPGTSDYYARMIIPAPNLEHNKGIQMSPGQRSSSALPSFEFLCWPAPVTHVSRVPSIHPLLCVSTPWRGTKRVPRPGCQHGQKTRYSDATRK